MPTQQELNDKYKNNLSGGITSKVSRDPNNNIILNNDKLTTNLIIEPLKWEYTNESINDVIETRFSYYTFPPRVTVVNRVNDDMQDVILPDVVLEDQTQSKSFYAKYQASAQDLSTIDVIRANGETPGGAYSAENYHYPIIDLQKLTSTIVQAVSNNGNQVRGRLKPVWNLSLTQANFPCRMDNMFSATGNMVDDPYNFVYTNPLNNTVSVVPYNVNSMLEERMYPISWGNVIDGSYQLDMLQSFVITKEILDLGKDLQFSAQIRINCLETLADRNISYYNRFAFRLIKYQDDPNDKFTYEVIETASTLTQGNIIVNQTREIELATLKTLKAKVVSTQASISAKITAIAAATATLKTAQQRETETSKAAQEAYNYWQSINILLFIRRNSAYKDFEAKQLQYVSAVNTRKSAQTTLGGLNADLTRLQSDLATTLNSIKQIENIDYNNLKYIFLHKNAQGAWPGNQSIFNINYILKHEDMKLGDRYDIEALVNHRTANGDLPGTYTDVSKYPWTKPGLSHTQTFWEIKSID